MTTNERQPETVAAEPTLAQQLVAWVHAGQLDKVEDAWISGLALLPDDPAFVDQWARAMRHAGAHDRVEELAALLIEDRLERGQARDALALLEPLAPLYPHSAVLRPLFDRAVREAYAELPVIDALAKLSGFQSAVPLPEALARLREWLAMCPGEVYSHYAWGEGVVRELDLAAKRVTIDFPREPGKTFTIEGVRKHLKHVPAGSFLARRAREPETLRAQAAEDPAGLVRTILQEREGRRIRQADLKALLLGGVLTNDEWTAWWSRAREAIKVDPFIEMSASGGAHAELRLLNRPRTLEEEIEAAFFDADAGTAARAELIRRLARRPAGSPVPADLVRRMAQRLHEQWRSVEPRNVVARLEIAYMLEDLAAAAPGVGIDVPAEAALPASIDDYAVLTAVEHVDYAVRALERLIERDGQAGLEEAARLMPRAPVRLAQAIWRALDEEHHHELAVRALNELFAEPLANVETFAWAMRATLDGSWGHVEDDFPAAALVPDLLRKMERWHRLIADGAPQAAAARTALSRMRTLLAAERYAVLAKAVESMPREAIARLRRHIQTHPALTESYKAQADRAIRLTRCDVEEEVVAGAPAAREDDVHYCTLRAQREKTAELRELISVKIPRNSKVIEEARIEGDLRENAGYQYAKEEQKMLLQQQATLTDLLARAKVVTAAEVDASRVGFGTRVRLVNELSGQEEIYTVLGRWEADPEHHVLSIQAPMAQQLLGRQAGERVVIQHPGGGQTPYRVVEITNALASGQWDAPEP